MSYLSEAEHKIVSDAVGEAEQNTSGEILTVLADRSDGYTDVALWWALAVSFTAMSFFAAFPQPFLDFWDDAIVGPVLGGWGFEWSTGEIVTATLALGIAVFALMLAIQSWQLLKFAMIPSPIRQARVHEQAVRHFKVGAERRTHGRTGILIYLSMREHRAEIVADEPIARRVDAEVWGEAMADMLGQIKQGHIAEAMAVGIRDVGFVLAEHFPRGDEDENELPDRLIEV
ncbi:MAG: hypothetical protein SXU28_05445 [Pseudomonadota bacterium]|nr:hypothetical protein [Pseudomonadota bacterium]